MMRALPSWSDWIRLVDWFAPRELDRDRPDDVRQARVLVTFNSLLCLVGVPLAAMFATHGSPSSAAAIASAIALGAGIQFGFRRFGGIHPFGNLMCANLLWLFVALQITLGGDDAPTASWYATIPVVAMALTGKRWALLWTGLCVLVLGAFEAARALGIEFGSDLTPLQQEYLSDWALVSLIVVMLGLAWGYELQQDRMRQRIERETAFSHCAINSLPGVFYLLDDTGRLVRWNDNLPAELGLTPAEMSALEPFARVPAEDVERVKATFAQIMAAGSGMVEARYILSGGRQAMFLFTGSRMEIDGRTYVIGTGIDITDRIEAETERQNARENAEAAAAQLSLANLELERRSDLLEQQRAELIALNQKLRETGERAEAASRAKTQFLANISHEIRTPMTAILGNVDQLTEGCPQGCDFGRSQQSECLGTVNRQARHLLAVIDDILDISRIEAGQLALRTAPCDLPALLRDVEGVMRDAAAAKDLALQLTLATPIPDTIRTDGTRLRQILHNLVDNAIKFTDAGRIDIEVRLVDGDAACPQLQIDVVDTGVGIPAERLPDLFQPFTQADASMTRQHGGTGLGLAISKRLAELLGGDITVASTHTCGSRFRVTLETGLLLGVRLVESLDTATRRAPAGATAAADSTLPACRLLLAEDGADNRKLIAAVLRKAGATVVAVEDGQQAVDAWQAARHGEQPFDLIVLDMQMPVLDGYQAATQMRNEDCRAPIVALTAHAMAHDRARCLAAGCSEYLTKPIDRRLLIETLAELLSQTAPVETPDGAHNTPRPPDSDDPAHSGA